MHSRVEDAPAGQGEERPCPRCDGHKRDCGPFTEDEEEVKLSETLLYGQLRFPSDFMGLKDSSKSRLCRRCGYR